MSKKTELFDSKKFLERQVHSPGVYQMYDSDGLILYVGKARSLKKRLASYFQKTLAPRTRALVDRIRRIDVTLTETETEALLLEQNLIKQQRPPYNILLRDDKSYPYIHVSIDQEYPRIEFHRGPKRGKGIYFGPFPNSQAVRESMIFLQKTFRVRQCDDNFFSNRSRPCLQYQIHRCTAPCVRAITVEQYQQDVKHSLMFLEGKDEAVLRELADAMEQSSSGQQYEVAARYRDQIACLRQIREPQSIEERSATVDVVALCLKDGVACIEVLTIRQGRVLGSKSYFPQLKVESAPEEILSAFLSQYYLGDHERHIPNEIILDRSLTDEADPLSAVLTTLSGHKVSLTHRVRTQRAKWQQLAVRSAEQNLHSHLGARQGYSERLQRLQEFLGLEALPQRLECFDVSHTQGEATVASCVVFDAAGPRKSDYRRFNIASTEAGDDYAAMREALMRRYSRLQSEHAALPDVLIIDGGKNQLALARQVLTELQVTAVSLLGLAKGVTRKAGFETIVRPASEGDSWVELALDSHDPALHLLQQMRDEAHRFAITGHKARRDKKRRESVLDGVAGIGPKRRRELLRFFGGHQEIARAGLEELRRVPGISAALAQSIYDAHHPAS